MKTFRELRSENNSRMNQFDERTQDQLLRIYSYLCKMDCNEYDSVRITGELITNVEQAVRQGGAIDDVTGSDLKAFCQGLMKGARPKTPVERWGFLLQLPFAYMAFFAFLFLTFNLPRVVAPSAGHIVPITLRDIVMFTMECTFLVVYFKKMLARVTYRSFRIKLMAFVAAYAIYMLVANLFILLPGINTVLFHANYLLLAALIVVLWLAATAARYWHASPAVGGGTTA